MNDSEGFEKELRSQLAYWQKTLYLQDWNIDFRICRNWEMNDALANCQWFIERKDAIIKVLDPDDLGSVKGNFLHDEELDYDISLVHELLHLHYCAFDIKEYEVPIEQAINAISRGIVKVWRENAGAAAVPPTSEGTVVVGFQGYL